MTHIHKVMIEPIPLPPGMSSITVLVASDDEAATRTLKDQLQAWDFTVLTTHTADTTLAVALEQCPYLLLVDADLDEGRICRTIKSHEALGTIPVILLAAADRDLLDSAADLVLTKPILTASLHALLRYVLHSKWRIDELSEENRKLTAVSENIEALKTNIITNVSHELRTPLVQVKAAVSLLIEDVMAQEEGREMPRVAEMALQAVARLESAIENIRQLAQTHQIRLTPVSAADAATLAIRNLNRTWESRGAQQRIEQRTDPNLPLVLGDKRAIAHLLQLLLDNALKFSPDDSPVYVLAHRSEDNRVWIAVQDFGIGIPPEEHSRIFEAFYQVDGSPTRRYGGTGTGLALATLLAKGMNTVIRLESAPNEGSTFWFMLPVANLEDYDGG